LYRRLIPSTNPSNLNDRWGFSFSARADLAQRGHCQAQDVNLHKLQPEVVMGSGFEDSKALYIGICTVIGDAVLVLINEERATEKADIIDVLKTAITREGRDVSLDEARILAVEWLER
jgi:hypothetical protein